MLNDINYGYVDIFSDKDITLFLSNDPRKQIKILTELQNLARDYILFYKNIQKKFNLRI